MYKGLRYKCYAIATIVALVLTNQATADVIDLSGSGFAIPDNSTAGASSTITIAAAETISDLDVTLSGLTHSWVGDLIVRLTSPSGTTADLFYRVGNGTFGDSSNLDGNYTFADGGANWAAAAGSVNGNRTVPVGTYQPSTNGGGSISLAAALAGESTQGDWTLTVSDNAQFDTGALGGWGLNIRSSISAVPEPDCLMLVVFTGIVMVRRRRRVVSAGEDA